MNRLKQLFKEFLMDCSKDEETKKSVVKELRKLADTIEETEGALTEQELSKIVGGLPGWFDNWLTQYDKKVVNNDFSE